MGQMVLCFQLSKEKEQAVGDVCRKLGIRQRKVNIVRSWDFLLELMDLTKNQGLLLKGHFPVKCWYSQE